MVGTIERSALIDVSCILSAAGLVLALLLISTGVSVSTGLLLAAEEDLSAVALVES